MRENFEKLLTFLNLEDKIKTITGKLIEITVDENRREWFFNIELDKPLEIELFKVFEKALRNVPNVTQSCDNVRYQLEYKTLDLSHVEDYYRHAIEYLKVQKPRFASISGFEVEVEQSTLNILCPKDGMYVENMLYEIKNYLSVIGFDIELVIRYCEDAPSISERMILEDTKEIEEHERHQKPRNQINYLTYKDRNVAKIEHAIADIPISEDDLTEYKSKHYKADFSLEAMVMRVEERKLNQRTTLFTFVLSDDDDSIYVKKFVYDADEILFLRAVEERMMMKVKGSAQYDKYVGEVVLTALALERTSHPIQQEKRLDTKDEKRIELHVHSKMSTLDGIDSISDYVDAALSFEHEAVALTDHNNVQSFPEFYRAVKNKPIKAIYGVEFNFADEADLQIAFNDSTASIKDAEYTVFDIETTSLSVDQGKIIEISAVKIKNHQTIDRFNKLVNPHEPLSDFTKKLTGITQSDVDTADDYEPVLKAFKTFIEGTILVAHNARFDTGFITHNFKKLGIYDQDYPTIDTLQIARQLYADNLKRFNLKAVAKYFKVELSRHHRAESDTAATVGIFNHMLTDLDALGVKTFDQLKDIHKHIKTINPYANVMSKYISVLVKSQTGLKNLYKLVSLANTDYFLKEPLMPKSVLSKYREGLLLGSGVINSQVFEVALNQSESNLEHVMDYYDYIEIQPFEDYLYLREDIENIEGVIEAVIKKIIRVAKKLDKPVIAVSNAYHLEKQAKMYRDIYVKTPVVGGGLHRLERYNSIPSQYFRTTDEMLEAFPFLSDLEVNDIVIKNPKQISDTITSVAPFKPELYAPTDDFLSGEGIVSIEKKLLDMVYSEAYRIYGNPLPLLVKARLEKEITSITKNKFSTVYYISHLLVKKSLDEGYLVGSRGSVGSSLVATLMDITEVNPLPPHYVCPKCNYSSFKMNPEEKELYGIRGDESALQIHLEEVMSGYDLPPMRCPKCERDLKKDGHDIPFETFLGFKGDKVPDIDLNFSGDYQPQVHEYIRTLFGHERAFRAGTISTVADKTAFGYVKGYLERSNTTLRKAEIERRAKVIAGVKRSTGQHPGGIVVVPNYKDIYDVTPVQYPADDITSKWRTTHFDYHAFEDNLFKLDVLGHDDPTMIRYLMDFVKKDPINFPFSEAQDIPLDDKKVYKLLSGTDVINLTPKDINSEVASFGVPEMGTSFVRGMLKDSRPKTFADIVKISGLSHGTDVWLNNAETLVTGKNPKYGKIPFSDVIGCRDDIMVYLIQNGLKSEVAFEISEFIRKGKAVNNPEKWEGYKLVMRENNIPEWYIWSAGQIKYMFPKAHATAYVMMALRIAWFKVHRPIYFYSAYFSKRARDFDIIAMQGGEYAIEKKMQETDEKGNAATDVERRLYTVLEVALEMVKRGYTFKAVDVNHSEARDFVVCDHGQSLRLPFIALEGLGMKVANSIVEAREHAPFTSLDDVKERTGITKTLFSKLDALGAFGDLPASGQMNIFDL